MTATISLLEKNDQRDGLHLTTISLRADFSCICFDTNKLPQSKALQL